MKTNLHLWSYLIQGFLEWEIIVRKVVKQNKTHILLSTTFLKSCRLWDKVEKYCKAGPDTEDKWGMRIACWVPKAKTHTQNM